MSALPKAEDDDVEMAELAETGPKWGTIAGRVLLGFLVVLLAIEAHGKFGYERTLAGLRANAQTVMGDALHGGQPEFEEWSMPFAKAQECIKGLASQNRKVVLGSPVVTLRWFSLFKTYVIQLHLDDDDVVNSMTTDVDE
jgi:hypothetical protein